MRGTSDRVEEKCASEATATLSLTVSPSRDWSKEAGSLLRGGLRPSCAGAPRREGGAWATETSGSVSGTLAATGHLHEVKPGVQFYPS